MHAALWFHKSNRKCLALKNWRQLQDTCSIAAFEAFIETTLYKGYIPQSWYFMEMSLSSELILFKARFANLTVKHKESEK